MAKSIFAWSETSNVLNFAQLLQGPLVLDNFLTSTPLSGYLFLSIALRGLPPKKEVHACLCQPATFLVFQTSESMHFTTNSSKPHYASFQTCRCAKGSQNTRRNICTEYPEHTCWTANQFHWWEQATHKELQMPNLPFTVQFDTRRANFFLFRFCLWHDRFSTYCPA